MVSSAAVLMHLLFVFDFVGYIKVLELVHSVVLLISLI